jgi:glycerol-3-phosphate dehydrogenase
MGEDVVNQAETTVGFPRRNSATRHLKIHGYVQEADRSDPLYWYGSDRDQLQKLVHEDPELDELLSKELQIFKKQVVHAVRYEMARTIEDFLARRTRALQLNALESVRLAPEIASIMAAELGTDKNWEKQQVTQFTELAKNYRIDSS